MKKLILVLVALMLVTPAFAADKIEIGGELGVTGIYRDNFSFASSGAASSWIMSQIKIMLTADINSNVSVVASLVNEKDWGVEWITPALSREVTLDLAYVKMTDLGAPGLDLTVGRQEFVIGDGLVASSRVYRPALYPILLGAPDLGMQKSADAINLAYAPEDGPVAVTFIKTKLFDNPALLLPLIKDADMYVLDVAFKAGMFTLEPYVTLLKANLGFNHWTYALLAKVTPVECLSISGEYALQTGDVGDLLPAAGFDASALNLGLEYMFQGGMKPRVNVGYAMFSGQPFALTTDLEAWIPVAPAGTSDRIGKIASAAIYTVGEGIGLAVLPATGLKAFRAGVGINPTEKIGLDLNLFHLTADEALVNDDVGMEADLGITLEYATDVMVGLDLGYFWAGDALGTMADNAWQAVLSLKLGF